MKLVFVLFSAFLFLQNAISAEWKGPDANSANLRAETSLTSSALSSPLSVDTSDYLTNDVIFTLDDGDKIGGMFFEHVSNTASPLVIVNLGALADRWFNTSRGLIKDLILASRIQAHVLIVDSMSSAGFFGLNHSLSPGGYDEGRLLLKLSKKLVAEPLANTSSIHLMGVSLGGAAVLHALLEDQRLHSHIFASALVFSGVMNQLRDTDAVLNTFGYKIRNSADKTLTESGKLLLYTTVPHFNSVLKSMGVKDFSLPYTSIGKTIYDAFADRIDGLNKKKFDRKEWLPSVKLDSVEDYLATSGDLLRNLNRVKVPIYLIHSEDDPVIPFSEFAEFATFHESDANIKTMGTRYGGHYGFESAYGVSWISEVIRSMLSGV